MTSLKISLLDLRPPILSVEDSNIELSTTNIKADNVFKVILITGEALILHIEFEAATKAEEMNGACSGLYESHFA
ncbi:MAG: hypothetical protein R2880_11610 [Deinococcales bacterium]